MIRGVAGDLLLSGAHVKPLIERHLGELGVPIYAYTTYHKGQKAVET
jgi:hypothetical protein